jgi:hypothetical protein
LKAAAQPPQAVCPTTTTTSFTAQRDKSKERQRIVDRYWLEYAARTVLDIQMPNTVFKHRMARIISTPEGIGDVPMNEDLPGGLAVEDDRFGYPTIRAYIEQRRRVGIK